MQSKLNHARMRQASGVASTREDVLNWLRLVAANQGKTKVTMAVRDTNDKSLLGYVSVETKSQEMQTGTLGIFIGYRSRAGIGSIAILKIEAIAKRDLGVSVLEARVANFNSPAIRFFLENGYSQIANNQKEIIFQKRLIVSANYTFRFAHFFNFWPMFCSKTKNFKNRFGN